MKITKKKAKNVLKKTLSGVKKGYKETSGFIGHYGPKLNKYTGSVASNIQGSFSVKPQGKGVEIDWTIKKKPIKKTKKIKISSKRKRNNVDWNNIGVNI